MMMRVFTERELKDFFEGQLRDWELASVNFKALSQIRKKPFACGRFKGYVQYNPARAISTMAKVDKETVKQRKCFLCGENRPPEQRSLELSSGWELLVNPYPILPYHFTIASRSHEPQKLDIERGFSLARQLPGMVVFFNDDGAGASAPDHLHFQAVPHSSLPLIKLIEENCNSGKGLELPFKIFENVEEVENLRWPVNAFFREGKDGVVRFVAIPRRAHRPACFFKEGKDKRAISPGAIDMAGVIVTPCEEDFISIIDSEIEEIYREVSVDNE